MQTLTERIQKLGKKLSNLTENDKRKIDCTTRELQRINELVAPTHNGKPKKKSTTKGILKEIRNILKSIKKNTEPVTIDLSTIMDAKIKLDKLNDI